MLSQNFKLGGGGGGGSSREDVQGTLEAASGMSSKKQSTSSEEEGIDLRRGPWTVEEDLLLINYIAKHGEGRWNSLALCAGLKRTGKSCRLRWLNYLRPDVRRGNITAEEQLIILELHSKWGNRWSKIAQYLPGRTDNEIKNYWRTRVQKHAKQLQCDVNSKKFKDAMRYLWIPRLAERAQAAASAGDTEVAIAGHGLFESSDADVSALSSNNSVQNAPGTAAPFSYPPPPPPELEGHATGGCGDVLDVHGALQGELMDLVMQQCDWGGTTASWSMEDMWSTQ